MNQKQRILQFFKNHDYRVTLGQLLSDPSGIGYKATSRFSDLRKEGYVITLTPGKTPSENSWTCVPPEEKGQLRFVA
jgi:hypothetical protein